MKSAGHIVAIVGLGTLVWTGSSDAVHGASPQAIAAAQVSAVAFQGEAAEQFLKTARLGRVWELGRGITRPRGVALDLGGVSHDAVFKWVDERRQGMTQLEDGTIDPDFWDSWQTEVAAYRVDRMIGLGMVPATVERPVRGEEGSLMWWVESMMTEEERLDQGRHAPDVEAWNRLNYKVWLFDELISNVDRHMNNLLITADFGVRLIDHSRSFRGNRDLRHPEKLTRFSRSLLEGLETLTFDGLKAQVGRYLSNARIERLLERRDAILALSRQRVTELGEAAVIYP